jgi:hypothetical protein
LRSEERSVNDLSWRDTFDQDFPDYEPDLDADCKGCDVRKLNGTPLHIIDGFALLFGSVWMEHCKGPVDVPFWFGLYVRNQVFHQDYPSDWHDRTEEACWWLENEGYGKVDVVLTNRPGSPGRSLDHAHSQLFIKVPELEMGTLAAGVGFAHSWMRIMSQAGRVYVPSVG